MFEINLSLTMGRKRQAGHGKGFMSDWMDKFLADRKKKIDQKETDDRVAPFAAASTPSMMAKLGEQLKQDALQFVQDTGIQFGVHGTGSLQIIRNEFPTVKILLTSEPHQPIIHCEGEIRNNMDAARQTVRYDIQIIGKGNNNLSYRVHGVECDEVGASAAILMPILSEF